MEKYDIKVSFNDDSTTFKLNKTSSLDKLIKFIEINFEDIKDTNYQILYNNMDIKLINPSQKILSIFKDDDNEINLNIINEKEEIDPNFKIKIICSYENIIKNFSISPSLTFQKFKYNILAYFPQLDEDNYIINYNETDITNIYSNDKLIKDIFNIDLNATSSIYNAIEIKLESKLKTIIEFYKRCSFCHDEKATNICKKCCIASCDKCSSQDNHHLTKKLNYVPIIQFKKFENDTLNDILKKISEIKDKNIKLHSDNLNEYLLEKIESIDKLFVSSKVVIIKIKDTQINNLKIILDNISNKHHPEEISNKLSDFYNIVLNYKKNPFFDCEESMKKINEFLKHLQMILINFQEYKNMLDEFIDKYNKCIDIDNKIIKLLDIGLIDFKNVFKGFSSLNDNCSQLMKVIDNSKVFIYNYSNDKFNIVNFSDDKNRFKKNFNNFTQINYNFDNKQQLFIITGGTTDCFFIYDYLSNDMKFINNLIYSHNWWPNLIPFRKVSGNKIQLILFCLSGSYSNKCEVLIFKEEERIINEQKEEENKEEENKEEEKKEEEEKLEYIENKDGISGIDAVEKELNKMKNSEEENKEEEKKEEENKEEEKKEEEKNEEIKNEEIKEENKGNIINGNEQIENKNDLKNQNENSENYILQWKQIPSTKVNHGQSISFIHNNQYLYLLFGYDYKLNLINIIERLNIEDINSLIIEKEQETKVNWESIEYKNPNNIPLDIYYSSILKINDNDIFILGGLKDKNEINYLFKYDIKENSILKSNIKLNIENVKFVNEKNFILLNKNYNLSEKENKKEYGLIDINNIIHLISQDKFEHRTIIYKSIN